MKIYVINLDRHEQRLAHMRGALKGLDFVRIAAVEGADTVCFLHERDGDAPKYLSRFEKACLLSHRKALETFLAGADHYGCFFEDDVFVSRDFPEFVRDETWIPRDAHLIKIETLKRPVVLGEAAIPCRNRSLTPLLSPHLGSAGYIFSRSGAQAFLARTANPVRTIDYAMFGAEAILNTAGIYQVVPALCIQSRFAKTRPSFAEINSSIQFRRRKPLVAKLKAEITRPFRQIKNLVQSLFTLEYWQKNTRRVAFE
jgi:glycosyl transferase family 25